MLMDIFSVFDEYNFNTFCYSFPVWLFSLIFPFMMIFSSIWVCMSPLKLLYKEFVKQCLMAINNSGKGMKLSGFPLLIVGLFSMMLSVNVSGMGAYFFGVSAHFTFGFSFAFVIWLALVVSSLFNSFEQTLSLLVPSSCPDILIPFMVLLELLTICLRPLTLVIRLAMNMAMGKIIMALIGDLMLSMIMNCSLISIMSGMLVSMGGIMILFLEFGVSFIQSYIFCMLLCLYADDHSI
nr:ATP synthase F0 subunit 6 [Vignadula atrata]